MLETKTLKTLRVCQEIYLHHICGMVKVEYNQVRIRQIFISDLNAVYPVILFQFYTQQHTH